MFALATNGQRLPRDTTLARRFDDEIARGSR
jgi:hypothetical protein